jgi:hypothetical protein
MKNKKYTRKSTKEKKIPIVGSPVLTGSYQGPPRDGARGARLGRLPMAGHLAVELPLAAADQRARAPWLLLLLLAAFRRRRCCPSPRRRRAPRTRPMGRGVSTKTGGTRARRQTASTKTHCTAPSSCPCAGGATITTSASALGAAAVRGRPRPAAGGSGWATLPQLLTTACRSQS